MIALRFLATGDTFQTIATSFKVGASTVSKIVEDVCQAILDSMMSDVMPVPNEEQWNKIAHDFETITNFPHCLGAIDGKHCRIMKPENAGSLYYNYKGYHSLVLMAVADANRKFVMVDVGSCGRHSDSGVLVSTNFWKLLNEGKLKIPKPSRVTGVENPLYVFVGDEAFPLRVDLMRPFPQSQLNFARRIFNYRLSRARRVVECAFGRLAAMWRILSRPLQCSVDLAVKIISAGCVLHNYTLKENHVFIAEGQGQLQDVGTTFSRNPTTIAAEARAMYTEYFNGAGAVPWQNGMV